MYGATQPSLLTRWGSHPGNGGWDGGGEGSAPHSCLHQVAGAACGSGLFASVAQQLLVLDAEDVVAIARAFLAEGVPTPPPPAIFFFGQYATSKSARPRRELINAEGGPICHPPQ